MENGPVCVRCGAPAAPRKYASEKKRYCGTKCQQAAWREANRERDTALKKKYRDANRDALNTQALARYYENRDEMLAQCKVRYQRTRLTSPWRIPLNAARARSAMRGWTCDLTEEWATARWTGRCEITDLPFVLGRPKGEPKLFAPSLDRIDPKRGYLRDNCRFVLDAVNAMKGSGTDEDVLFIARALVKRYGS